MTRDEDVDVTGTVEATRVITKDGRIDPVLAIPRLNHDRRSLRVHADALEVLVTQHFEADEAVGCRLAQSEVHRITDEGLGGENRELDVARECFLLPDEGSVNGLCDDPLDLDSRDDEIRHRGEDRCHLGRVAHCRYLGTPRNVDIDVLCD